MADPELETPEAAASARGLWISIALSLAFWLMLPWFGLPGPDPGDDLVFVPPAIEFAHGHPMSNPALHDLLTRWGMRTDRWFVHPPVYPFILGVWLRIFGISAAAMLAFQAAVNCAVQLGLFNVCARLGLKPGWALGLGAVYFCGTLNWGLRPEPVAFLFLVLGIGALLRQNSNLFRAAFFLSCAGAVLAQAAIFGFYFSRLPSRMFCYPRNRPGLRWAAASSGCSWELLLS